MSEKRPLTYSELHSLPKVDLHRHLEGSLRLSTLSEIAHEYGLDLPARDLESLRPHVQMVNDPHDHETFLAKFGVLRHFYQTPEVVARLTYEAIIDASADNVRYLELRFSPQALARVRGFSLSDVTDWVIQATAEATKVCEIEVGLIITLLRHESVELAEEVVQLAFDRKDKGIVGIDIAGDAVNFPAEPFEHLFKSAHESGLGITVHAGEWMGPESVVYAIEKLYARRIGHGIRTLDSADAIALVLEREIALEVCPTSNLHTGAITDLKQHPLPKLLAAGLRATINTDDPSVSNSHLTDEYEVVVEEMGLGYDALRQMSLNGMEAAFLSNDKKVALVKKFKEWLPKE